MDLIDIEELHCMWIKSSQIIVDLPMIGELFAKIERVATQENKVKDLHTSDVSSLKTSFSEILACCRTGVKTNSFADFHGRVQPLQRWCHQARILIKEYYKSIDLKHNKLDLIDSSLTGKPFERKNPFGQTSVALPTDSDPVLSMKECDDKSSSQHR